VNAQRPPAASDAIVSRHTDIDPLRVASAGPAIPAHAAEVAAATVSPLISLPPVDWKSINQSAPARLSIGLRRADDPLPEADIVILTWTSAEWFALDHVFLNSRATGTLNEYEWRTSWLPYSRGSSDFAADLKSGALWGSFQLVRIDDQSGRPWRVLLFKSNSHLAHPPWLKGLSAMLGCILGDTKADRIYTIGTAGGARKDQRLGDSVITNAALLDLGRPQNTGAGNGDMYRCPTWFPATGLIPEVEQKLLFRMNKIVTPASLADLFAQLKAKHPDDAGLSEITLADLLNDGIRPDHLDSPKIETLKDVPLLTTDFYYIAAGDSADAYAFLEMDDAIIAREANRFGIRFACIRNISDPAVRKRTSKGTPISDAVRADWSGLIYTTFGLQTSFNGALATWATIAGEGSAVYNPPRHQGHEDPADPLEVKLAFQVRSCGTCEFFWPPKKRDQPYGPYTAFDFDQNVPYTATPSPGPSFPWMTGRTRPASFPNPEVIDGCRKAPIMTIGINPNLTAFLPSQSGASWCYPNFSSDNETDAWAKYAWYYRYRTVYQERLTLDVARKFILSEGRVVAERSGHIVVATRTDDGPSWTVTVRYDGDVADTVLEVPGKAGDAPYVLLLDQYPKTNVFAKGDIIAGRVSVPQGIQMEIMQQQQGYYMQFVPVLRQLQETVRRKNPSANLRIGEDVCQLDMVACASPHWTSDYLGGSPQSVATIVDNCVTKNAWALKQLVQTRPAVLYVVSQATWTMFHGAFGAYVRREKPLSTEPVDHDYTLLRETTDPAYPAYIEFDVTVDEQRYTSRTRLVITPHFSYSKFFLPQYRLSPLEWAAFKLAEPECVAVLTPANGFQVEDKGNPADYIAVELSDDPASAASARAWLCQQFPAAYETLVPFYYDPHAMMASVLNETYAKGELAWKDKGDGTGYLGRTAGSCHFCSNRHWQFPFECRYEKTKETPPPPDFLEKVAERIATTGKPTQPPMRADAHLGINPPPPPPIPA
jgi:nucleoside phosphorylase